MSVARLMVCPVLLCGGTQTLVMSIHFLLPVFTLMDDISVAVWHPSLTLSKTRVSLMQVISPPPEMLRFRSVRTDPYPGIFGVLSWLLSFVSLMRQMSMSSLERRSFSSGILVQRLSQFHCNSLRVLCLKSLIFSETSGVDCEDVTSSDGGVASHLSQVQEPGF